MMVPLDAAPVNDDHPLRVLPPVGPDQSAGEAAAGRAGVACIDAAASFSPAPSTAAHDTSGPATGEDGAGAARPSPGIAPALSVVGWRVTTLMKKARVRAAAARLLARTTIHSVTLEEVSLAAGLTKSSCYYYYGTRDALLADTLTEHLVAIDRAVCGAFDATVALAPADRMAALAHAFLRVALTQRDAHLALRLNTRLVSAARRPAVVARSRQVTDTLRTALLVCVPGLRSQPAMAGLLMRQFMGGLSEAITWFRPDERMDSLGLARLIASQTLMTARAVVGGDWVLPPPATVCVPEQPAEELPGAGEVAAGGVGGTGDRVAGAFPRRCGEDEAAPASEDRPTGGLGEASGGAAGAPIHEVAPATTGLDHADPGAAARGERGIDAADPPPDPPRDAIWLTPEQARRSLPKLVRAAAGGIEVVLTHRGVPTAKLVAATRERLRLRGVMTGRTS